jgi:hypothetical protein
MTHITIERELAAQITGTLEALYPLSCQAEIAALKQALAQPVQEPVSGVVMRDGRPTLIQDKHIEENDQRLYTHQPAAQRQWDYDTLHAAWHAVGADVAGLKWETFVAKLKAA